MSLDLILLLVLTACVVLAVVGLERDLAYLRAAQQREDDAE